MFKINFANDWIRIADLWYRKQSLYQRSHNHCSPAELACTMLPTRSVQLSQDAEGRPLPNLLGDCIPGCNCQNGIRTVHRHHCKLLLYQLVHRQLVAFLVLVQNVLKFLLLLIDIGR